MTDENQDFDIKDFEVGSFGFHEALHTTRVVADLFERDILDHPRVQVYEDIREKAAAIAEQLEGLYQLLGQKTDHLSD